YPASLATTPPKRLSPPMRRVQPPALPVAFHPNIRMLLKTPQKKLACPCPFWTRCSPKNPAMTKTPYPTLELVVSVNLCRPHGPNMATAETVLTHTTTSRLLVASWQPSKT